MLVKLRESLQYVVSDSGKEFSDILEKFMRPFPQSSFFFRVNLRPAISFSVLYLTTQLHLFLHN